MDAVYNRWGDAVAFVAGSRIVSLQGASLAWVDGSGNVYNYGGRHLGWWRHGHLRGHDGGVVAWTRGASSLGVPTPHPQLAPPPPRLSMEPHRHHRTTPPPRPAMHGAWAAQTLVADAS